MSGLTMTLYPVALGGAVARGAGNPPLVLVNVFPTPEVVAGRADSAPALTLVPFLKGDKGDPGDTPTPEQVIAAFEGAGHVVDVMNLDGTLAYRAFVATGD